MTETSKFWGELFCEILWIEGKMAKIRPSKNQFSALRSHCLTGKGSFFCVFEGKQNKSAAFLIQGYAIPSFTSYEHVHTCKFALTIQKYISIDIFFSRKPF